MYDIRQFKPALYALVILGITGFALATQSPGMWVLSHGAILLNAWLMRTNRFQPMPRLAANAVTILGVLVLLLVVRRGGITPIIVIGQFLVLLQIIKLYEQRANRDYAQLLILSLLLMVAAAISTYSLIFGLLFIVYLFLSLYCCLLFHLKVETDHARQAIGIPEERLNPATLRQDQRYLSRSMRRLTGLVSIFAVTISVVTFLFFPRGAGAGLLGQFQWKPSQTLTGFSDSVSFQNVARITQNTQPVAWVTITSNGQPYQPPVLLLRGLTLNRYSGGGDESGDNAYQWTRTVTDTMKDDIRAGEWRYLDEPPQSGDLRQQIKLDPTGTSVLFAMAGVVAVKPDSSYTLRYSRADEVIQLDQTITQPMRYEVISRDRLTVAPRSTLWPFGGGGEGAGGRDPRRRPKIDPKVEEFARNPEVCGSDANGALAARRPLTMSVTRLDAAIARNIEQYLRTNYSYTLDLTDARRIEGQDPIVAFLYDLKRGHCEYFAGAMTLMCQSLGMQARMVVGFKCDEYNSLGNFYTVRQSHAHAWVEVLTDSGAWETFDPTSSREAASARNDSWWQQAKAFFHFLEYTWANSVIAYDQSSRSNLIQTVDRGLVSTADQSSRMFDDTMDWLSDQRAIISSNVLLALISIMVMLLVLSVLWFFWEKWRLRRRARRIGLDALPASEQMKLARQLGFYDDLMRLLERHRIIRPAHLTPLEFSESLSFLPSDAFESVQGLTEAFYRVRFGREQLSTEQRRHLANAISGIEESLSGAY